MSDTRTMDEATQASIEFYDKLWSGTTRVDQHHKCRAHAIEKVLRATPEPTGRPRRILELGCGMGIISELLSRYGDVVGVDQSRAGIEAARRHVRGRFEIGVLPAIGIPDRDFDVVVLTQVIEHFSDADQVTLLQNARAVTRPGGHLIITTPNRPVSERMRFARGELQPIENWMDADGLRALLERTGWRVTDVRFAFNFFPVLVSRFGWLRAVRFVAYDLLRLRNVIEDATETRPIGDCTVALAVNGDSGNAGNGKS
jgi:SAM-dependent methyltransferase